MRRARRQTFIVAEAHGGTLRQVGRSCLRAYTGKAQAVPVAALLSELEELRSELEREREPGRIAVEAFLAHAACVIRLEGYRRGGITRKAAEANYRALEDGAPGAEEPSHADRHRAERTLRWARALPRRGDDLLAQIAAAAAEPFVTAGTAGVLAYAPVAYGQARRREITRERAAAKELGEAGSRRHFSLVLEHAARLPTRFGPESTRPLYVFRAEGGQRLVWRAARWQDISVGERVTLLATVGERKLVRGQLETTLHDGRLRSGFAVPGCEGLHAAAVTCAFKERRERGHGRGALAATQGRE